MFGTVAKMKFKPGMLKEFIGDTERDTGMDNGGVALYVFQMTENPDEVYVIAISESEEAYRENANAPETHERFLRMMEYLTEEPEWNDGHVIYSVLKD